MDIKEILSDLSQSVRSFGKRRKRGRSSVEYTS